MNDEKRPACEHEADEIFFPALDIYTEETMALGKSICATCPVFDWCEKTFKKEKYGVFAGKGPKERGFRVVPIEEED